jgi:hypothetical protein
MRLRHIRRRPDVSATHLPGEELAVTVHGRAVPLDVGAPEHADFRETVLGVYVPRYGEDWEAFLDSGVVYSRIDPVKMFTFRMVAGTETSAADLARRTGGSAPDADRADRG